MLRNKEVARRQQAHEAKLEKDAAREKQREARRKAKEEAEIVKRVEQEREKMAATPSALEAAERARKAKRAASCKEARAKKKSEAAAGTIKEDEQTAATKAAAAEKKKARDRERKMEARKAEAAKEDGDGETISLEELFAPLRKARYRCSQLGLDHLESIRQADEEREHYYSKQMSAIQLTPVISDSLPEVEQVTLAAVVSARDAVAAAESIASTARSTAEATDFIMFEEKIGYYTQECVNY